MEDEKPENKKYKSRKGPFLTGILIGFFLIFISLISNSLMRDPFKLVGYWILIPFGLFIFFMSWIYFGTGYELTPYYLYYQSGPLKGRIALKRIREVVQDKTMWVGFKPALAGKGLIIKYDAYEEIYISPESNQEFVSNLLQFNDAIKIQNP